MSKSSKIFFNIVFIKFNFFLINSLKMAFIYGEEKLKNNVKEDERAYYIGPKSY